MTEPLLELPLPFATLSVSPFGVGLAAALLLLFRALVRAARALDADVRLVTRVYAASAVAALAASAVAERLLAGPTSTGSYDLHGLHGLHGGVLAGVGALGAFALSLRLPVGLAVLDRAAGAALLGGALVRVGCHLVGCHAGRLLPPGAPGWLATLGTYPRVVADGQVVGSAPFLRQLAGGVVTFTDAHTRPVHPAALYDAVLLALVAAVVFLVGRRSRRAGLATGLAAGLGALALAAGVVARGASPAPVLGAGLALVGLTVLAAWRRPA